MSFIITQPTRVVSITQFKQKSQDILDELNSGDEPMLLMQGKDVVAVVTPGKTYLNSIEREKKIAQSLNKLDKKLDQLWGDKNKNLTITQAEIDNLSF